MHLQSQSQKRGVTVIGTGDDIINVNKTIVIVNNQRVFEEEVRVFVTTMDEFREVHIPVNLTDDEEKIEELQITIKIYIENSKKYRYIGLTDDELAFYVCVNEIGDLIRPRTLSDSFKRVVRKNKIRDLRLYDCRHTAATIMLKKGVSMKQIQMILGHSDFATTANIYSRLDYSDKIPATETMKEIIYGKDNETV